MQVKNRSKKNGEHPLGKPFSGLSRVLLFLPGSRYRDNANLISSSLCSLQYIVAAEQPFRNRTTKARVHLFLFPPIRHTPFDPHSLPPPLSRSFCLFTSLLLLLAILVGWNLNVLVTKLLHRYTNMGKSTRFFGFKKNMLAHWCRFVYRVDNVSIQILNSASILSKVGTYGQVGEII